MHPAKCPNRTALLFFVAVAALGCGADVARAPLPASKPPPASTLRLQARFFGTTTIEIDDGETAIMTDGFFSRPGRGELLGEIEPNWARIDEALKRGEVSNLAAVLVCHTHYDHALDSAVVALRTGAKLVGSKSAANIAVCALPKERVVEVARGAQLPFGRFTVEVIESKHSPRAIYLGEITEPLCPPARSSAYKEGGSFSFVLRHDAGTIVIHPSANFLPDQYAEVKADVVFLGIGGLGKQSDDFARDYWREVVRKTGAKVVIPVHWDDFMLPLDQPLQPMPVLMDDFGAGVTKILGLADADGVTVVFPPVFEPIEVIALARATAPKPRPE